MSLMLKYPCSECPGEEQGVDQVVVAPEMLSQEFLLAEAGFFKDPDARLVVRIDQGLDAFESPALSGVPAGRLDDLGHDSQPAKGRAEPVSDLAFLLRLKTAEIKSAGQLIATADRELPGLPMLSSRLVDEAQPPVGVLPGIGVGDRGELGYGGVVQ